MNILPTQRLTVAGQMHCDKHVVKMILEYGQILSTTYRLRHQYTKENGMTKFIPLSDKFDKLYKMAFVNHPSTIWARHPFSITHGFTNYSAHYVMNIHIVMARFTWPIQNLETF